MDDRSNISGLQDLGDDRDVSVAQSVPFETIDESALHIDIDPISAHSYNRLVADCFLGSARVHNIDMPWESSVAKHILGDDVKLLTC